jgi:predicted thioesterase
MLVNLAHQWWFSMHDHLATYLLTILQHSSCLQLVADHLPKDSDALFIGVPCIT